MSSMGACLGEHSGLGFSRAAHCKRLASSWLLLQVVPFVYLTLLCGVVRLPPRTLIVSRNLGGEEDDRLLMELSHRQAGERLVNISICLSSCFAGAFLVGSAAYILLGEALPQAV
jgi:hypothetical protein